MTKKVDKQSIKLVTKRGQNKVELEQLILRTVVMRLTEKEALGYIKKNYKSIESSRYYEIKKSIKDKIITEGYNITSKNGLFEQHMMRIHALQTIEREQWINFLAAKTPLLKSTILEKIQKTQVYLSSAYDYVRAMIKNQEDLQIVIAKHGTVVLKT